VDGTLLEQELLGGWNWRGLLAALSIPKEGPGDFAGFGTWKRNVPSIYSKGFCDIMQSSITYFPTHPDSNVGSMFNYLRGR
jgi:hypothetical protein